MLDSDLVSLSYLQVLMLGLAPERPASPDFATRLLLTLGHSQESDQSMGDNRFL